MTRNDPIAIIGATGKTGRPLVGALERLGASRLRVLTRSTDSARRTLGPHVEVVGGFDYSDPETASVGLAGARQLYLLSTIEIPPEKVKTVIDLARDAGVEHVVRLSVYGVDDRGQGFGATADGENKRAIEEHVRAAGLRLTAVRPTWFAQNIPWQFGHDIRTRGVLRTPFGSDARVNFIDVEDIAEVAAVALTTDGTAHAYHEVTGPASHTMGEVAAMLSRTLGRPISYEDVSLDDARTWMTAWGLPVDAVDELVAVFAEGRAGRTGDVTSDVERVTGRPPMALEQSLARQAHELGAVPQAAS